MATTPQACLQRADVKGRLPLALQSIVFDRSTLFSDQLSHGVGEIASTVHARVTFDDLRLATGAGHDQGARISDDPPFFRIRCVNYVNGLRQPTPRPNLDDGAVREKCG